MHELYKGLLQREVHITNYLAGISDNIRSKLQHGSKAALVNKARGSKELLIKPYEAKSKLIGNNSAI